MVSAATVAGLVLQTTGSCIPVVGTFGFGFGDPPARLAPKLDNARIRRIEV